MEKDLIKWRGAIFYSIFLVVLALVSGMVAVNFQPCVSFVEKAAQPMSLTSNNDWHEGMNQSTSQVDVTYTTEYSTIMGATNTMPLGLFSQNMQLTYNDGSDAKVVFEIHCVFDQGGLDVSNKKVLDWNKLNHIELIMHSESMVNGTWTSTMYNFQGFVIVSGNAGDLSLSKVNDGGNSFYAINNVIGSISYWSNAAKIGEVMLSTEQYTFNGETLQESVATFNVTINSMLSNLALGNSGIETQTPVPTVLTFQVTHKATDTEYKYGANIDWSGAKAFPTMPSLTTGQNFSLVAQDLLSYSYSTEPGGKVTSLSTFSTNANNDSAIYFLNGTEVCREQLTTQYTMDGSSQVHNTTRIYMENAIQSDAGSASSIYVVFDGFRYNESTGLAFDPAVIMPNSIASSSGQGSTGLDLMVPLLIGAALIAIVAVVFVRRRHNSPPYTK
jgi:hypothetical protein